MFDFSARQTAVGVSISGPKVGGVTPGAFFLAFIQNDVLPAVGFGFLPYHAYGELKNEHWRITGGLQLDVFTPPRSRPCSPWVCSLAQLPRSARRPHFPKAVLCRLSYGGKVL